MNTKSFHIVLSIWIFAVIPLGVAEILPEEYPGRAAQTNMDQTAALGADITRGLYERCLAVQVDPLSFAVPNKIGWYLDQSTRAAVDSKAKALVPSYVNTNTVHEGTTDILMLTVAGVFTALDIGDHTSLFTGMPAIGTNPPTYGDYPWRIYVTNLQERYKAIWAQKQTESDVNHTIEGSYRGHGVGTTRQAAYNAAVASYDWVQHTTKTNLIITGTLNPNAAGTYTEVDSGAPDKRKWEDAGSVFVLEHWIHPFDDDSLTYFGLEPSSWKKAWGNIEGAYEPTYNATGTAYVALDIVETGEINPATEYNQHCKIAWWSNFVVQGGSGRTNENPEPYDGNETEVNWHEPVYNDYTNLVVSPAIPGKVTVASSGISNQSLYTYTTNLIVTGTNLNPDVTGTYIESETGPDVWRWINGVYYIEHYIGGNFRLHAPGDFWANRWVSSSLEGDYGPMSGVTGIVHVALSVVETITANPATPVDYSGTYYPVTSNYWQGDAGYIFVTNGLYTIYSSLTLDANAAYLVNGTLEGNYSAVNFVATTTVSEDSGGAPPCVGTYIGGSPTWTLGSWSATENGGNRYISMGDINSSWFKSGTGPVGTYSPSGTGTYGDVTASLDPHHEEVTPGYYTTDAVYRTHSTTNIPGLPPGEVTNIFYECWLTKVAAYQTKSSLATNIEHRVRFWVWPTKPTYGTTNIFNKQNLGLTETNWNANAVGNWTEWTFENLSVLEDYWTAKLTTPPDPPPEPITVNTTTCSGFRALTWTAIDEWKFLYCTNKFW